jgi:hypothetical protein
MAAPAMHACAEKRRLIMRFTAAVEECNRLQTKQTSALLRGEGFLWETQIAQAMERRDRTKFAVMGHQQEHGC